MISDVAAGQPVSANHTNQIVRVANSVSGMSGAGGISVSHQDGSILIAGNTRTKSGLLGDRMVSFNKDAGSADHKLGEFVSVIGMFNDVPNAQGMTAKGIIIKTSTYNSSTPATTPKSFGVVSQNTQYNKQGEIIITGLAMALCDASDLAAPADAHGVWIDTANRTGKLCASGGDFPVLGVAATAATGTKHWCLINLDGDYSIPVDPFKFDDLTNAEEPDATAWEPFDDETDGVNLIVCMRVHYFPDGDQTIYAYYRTLSFNARGQLYKVSAETRLVVDTPEDCDA